MIQKVLLVEDSAALGAFIRSVLETSGSYEIEHIEHGFNALKAIPRGDYTLMLLDINIPGVSGIELAQFARKHPRYQDIPILVMSTDTSPVNVERAIQAGASDFLVKPFTPEQLLYAINKALDAKVGR